MIKKISYLGLGTMGSGMASNLLKAGYQTYCLGPNSRKMRTIREERRTGRKNTGRRCPRCRSCHVLLE
jgi:3-hydroxyisobutyrate dehydrogenase-like beta-hydroxyacid dehydrogenase